MSRSPAPLPLVKCRAERPHIRIPRHKDRPLMRLVDLDPGWFVTDSGRDGMGLTFLCPCCRRQYLGVWFANPIDGAPPAAPGIFPLPRWLRTGETFDTLTLQPSIDCSKSGHWHAPTNSRFKRELPSLDRLLQERPLARPHYFGRDPVICAARRPPPAAGRPDGSISRF